MATATHQHVIRSMLSKLHACRALRGTSTPLQSLKSHQIVPKVYWASRSCRWAGLKWGCASSSARLSARLLAGDEAGGWPATRSAAPPPGPDPGPGLPAGGLPENASVPPCPAEGMPCRIPWVEATCGSGSALAEPSGAAANSSPCDMLALVPWEALVPATPCQGAVMGCGTGDGAPPVAPAGARGFWATFCAIRLLTSRPICAPSGSRRTPQILLALAAGACAACASAAHGLADELLVASAAWSWSACAGAARCAVLAARSAPGAATGLMLLLLRMLVLALLIACSLMLASHAELAGAGPGAGAGRSSTAAAGAVPGTA